MPPRRRSRRCSTRPDTGRRLDRPRRRLHRELSRARRSSASAPTSTGLRIAVDCANGAYAGIAPEAFEQLGADVTAIGDEPNGENINEGCGATDLALLQQTVREGGHDLGVAFDGDGDRMLAVDGDGNAVDGDQILAILALHLRGRRRRGHRDDEPRLPPADGRARHPGRDDAGRRPLRARGAPAREAGSSAASSRVTSSASATTSPATASPPRCSSATRFAAARSPKPRP